MSKILVVEPYKILQRAIAGSFFPEHEVQIINHLPEMNAFELDYDIVVVDAGALRERNIVGDLNHRVQGWRVPTIWLDETISTVVPTRDNLVVLHKPILKNDLLAAFAQCQEKTSTMSLAKGSTEPGEKVHDKSSDLEPHRNEVKGAVIELIDVVEEGTVSARAGRPSRKKK
jgi:hypothetical protein